MALKRVWMPSPNKSSRGGSSVRLIVLHTTEGAQTYQSLGNFFASSSSGVSSHVGIDNTGNTVGEYVKPGDKAWTAGNANPVAVQAEFCTPSGAAANWSSDYWKTNMRVALENAAQWVREESARFNIPIVGLTPGQAQGSGRGVCQHNDLGAWGGGHYDCGKGFPMGYFLDMCKGKPSSPTGPDTTPERYNDMFYLNFTNGNASVVVPNYYGDGKGRLRMYCTDESALRVNIIGAPTVDVKIGPKAGTNGAGIPKDKTTLVIRRDSGSAPIAACFSK
jgi:N-acetylmuramoyl-L-alanine amidase